MTPPAFTCAYDETTRILRVTGGLDVAAARTLRRELIDRSHSDPGAVTMDLSLVDEMSDAALGVIAAARAELRSHFQSLTFVSTPGTVAWRLLPKSGMAIAESESV